MQNIAVIVAPVGGRRTLDQVWLMNEEQFIKLTMCKFSVTRLCSHKHTSRQQICFKI